MQRAQCHLDPAISYDGHDFARVPAQDAAACCALCSARIGCKAWTLYQKVCYLKDSSAAGRVPCDACSSGLPQPCSEHKANRTCPGPRCHWGGGGGGGCAAAAPPPPWTPPVQLPPKWNVSGITFTGGRYCPNVTMGSPAALRSLQHLASTGANWVAIIVTQYQWQLNTTEIFPLYNGSAVRDVTSDYYEFVTLTGAEVRAAIRQAHALGLRVMLKPHVDLLRDNKPRGRFWRGDIGGCPATDWGKNSPKDIAPFNGSQWDAWFASYSRFLAPYASLAEAEGVELLSLNTELYCPNKQAAHWRALVSEVRQRYSGRLTVAAIHGHEEEMQWWDAVDVIGIDAYYNVDGYNLGDMVEAWQPYVERARQLHEQYNKPVLFTEIGYCSGHCSRAHVPVSSDYAAHAQHYEAVFEAFRNASVVGGSGQQFRMNPGSYEPESNAPQLRLESGWFLGSFWWNWNTDDGRYGSGSDDCLTPQWKPAEQVLRKYYRATQPQPQPPLGPALCMGAGRCTC
eukprot:SAG31_NODE_33_length_32018_cov_69.763088_10_plen_511_part_00